VRRASEEVDRDAVSKRVTHTKDVREIVGKGVEVWGGERASLYVLGSTFLCGVKTAGVSCRTVVAWRCTGD
jgi:hypothetical protein